MYFLVGDQLGHQQNKTSDGEEHSSSVSIYNEDEEDETPEETTNETIKDDEDFEDQEQEIIGGNTKVDKERQKMIELEKLNQLENFYRFNLLQQQHQQLLGADGVGGIRNKSLGMSPLASFAAATSVGDIKPNDIYGENVALNHTNNNNHHNRNNNNNNNRPAGTSGKAPVNRRPLSSWKQSISACGPGPAPWVDKATLISLGIQGKCTCETKTACVCVCWVKLLVLPSWLEHCVPLLLSLASMTLIDQLSLFLPTNV